MTIKFLFHLKRSYHSVFQIFEKYNKNENTVTCVNPLKSTLKQDSTDREIRKRAAYVKKVGTAAEVQVWHMCHDHVGFVEHISLKVMFACNSVLCRLNIVAWWHLLSHIQYAHFHDILVRHLKVLSMDHRHTSKNLPCFFKMLKMKKLFAFNDLQSSTYTPSICQLFILITYIRMVRTSYYSWLS